LSSLKIKHPFIHPNVWIFWISRFTYLFLSKTIISCLFLSSYIGNLCVCLSLFLFFNGQKIKFWLIWMNGIFIGTFGDSTPSDSVQLEAANLTC
jgi:hypothetical protein